jgi:hypothetical protein
MNDLGNGALVEEILLGLIGVIIFFDIYLYLNKTKGDTISHILKTWVYGKFFFITYFWGVLAGHFFLGSYKSFFGNATWNLLIILEIAVIFFAFGVFFKIKINPNGQIILLLIGLSIGHFFWSLN